MVTTILANWKSNKTRVEAVHWLETFLDLYEPVQGLQVIITPPSLYLEPLKLVLDHRGVQGVALAAQDISPYPFGSYTGAITAEMVVDFAQYVIVGHSERRHYFHESHADIAMKTEEAQSAGLTPILCIDKPYVRQQLAALEQHVLEHDLLIGYGPVEAVNQEIPHRAEDQQEDISAIQHMIPNIPILYGGSIRPENSMDYLKLKGVSGLMVGSSCLDPHEFAKICQAQ